MPLILPNTIANDIPADGAKLGQNFETIEDWANQDAITADGSTGMTAPLLLPGAPTQPNQATTKDYVDTQIGLQVRALGADGRGATSGGNITPIQELTVPAWTVPSLLVVSSYCRIDVANIVGSYTFTLKCNGVAIGVWTTSVTGINYGNVLGRFSLLANTSAYVSLEGSGTANVIVYQDTKVNSMAVIQVRT